MAVAISPQSLGTISAIDALWALIQAQPKKVREALCCRMAEDVASAKNIITPAMAVQIRKAREEYSKAQTTRCETPEQMLQFFENL